MIKNEYIIYTRRIAFELRIRGFDIIKVRPNPNKPEFDCYYFKNSEEFQKALKEISGNRS